jgi:hypothetical protein
MPELTVAEQSSPNQHELNLRGLLRENRAIAAVSIFAYAVVGAVALALAAWIVLLLLITWGRRDAPPYWDE